MQGAICRLDERGIDRLGDQVRHVRHRQVELCVGRAHAEHLVVVRRVPVGHVVGAEVEGDVAHEDRPHARVEGHLPEKGAERLILGRDMTRAAEATAGLRDAQAAL